MEHRIPVWVWLIAIGLCGVIFFVGRRTHQARHPITPAQQATNSSSSTGGDSSPSISSNATKDSLHIEIPAPSMPAHNGYNDFLNACKLLVDERGVERAYADADNSTVSASVKDALLKKNAQALSLLRAGLRFDYQCPPIRSFAQTMPYSAHFRGLMHLLMLDAQVQMRNGQWQSAMLDALQAIRMGEKIQRGTILIGYLEGLSFQSTGARVCWSHFSHLNLPQTMSCLQTLQGTLAEQPSVADAIREEKWMALATIKSMLEQTDKTDKDHSLDAQGMKQLPEDRKKQLIADYVQYLDAWIANANKPYSAFVNVPPPTDTYVRQFAAPNLWKQYLLKAAIGQANLRMLLIALAIQAYHLQHHALPPKLAMLSPAYLRALPDDPFALQNSFLYRPQTQSYVLYSLGPDGKDDGGHAVDTGGDDNQRYRISEDSQGDIVGGINM